MKIKFLAIIASFLILPLAITSCLDSDNNYELGSDDTITAFELDTIYYGIKYKFTIDQIRGEIYNQDSVPYGSDTIINKILIKTLSHSGWIVTGDTLFNQSDSVDFKQTMTDEGVIKPLVFKVYAQNGETSKEYKIWVNRHRVDPDSLVWGTAPYTSSFSGGQVAGSQKTKMVSSSDNVFMFASNGTNLQIYKGPSKNTWENIAYTGLPDTDINIESAIAFKDALYITNGQSIYQSTDGATWTSLATQFPTEEFSTSVSIETFITVFSDKENKETDKTIAGIIKDEKGLAFATAVLNNEGYLVWTRGAKVPSNFPTGRLSATKSFTTLTGGLQAMLISTPSDDDTATNPWFSEDGLDWGVMTTTAKYSLPKWKEPTILYYGKTLYAFGGAYNSSSSNDFSNVYTSVNGIVWEKIKRRFLFPNDDGVSKFKGRSGYSITIDKDNYVWMGWGKGASNSDEVWRGKLNRVNFDKQ